MKPEIAIDVIGIAVIIGVCPLLLFLKATRDWVRYRKELSGIPSRLLVANITLWVLALANPSIYWQAPNICVYSFCTSYLLLCVCTQICNLLLTFRSAYLPLSTRWRFQIVLFHMSLIGMVSPMALVLGHLNEVTNTAGCAFLIGIGAALLNGVCYVLGGIQGQELWCQDMTAQGKKVVARGRGLHVIDE